MAHRFYIMCSTIKLTFFGIVTIIVLAYLLFLAKKGAECFASYRYLKRTEQNLREIQSLDDRTEERLSKLGFDVNMARVSHGLEHGARGEGKFNMASNHTYRVCTYGILTRNPDNETGSLIKSRGPFDAFENYRFKKCSAYTNCEFTTSHEEADVVLVEAAQVGKHRSPPPVPRLPGQLWILFTWESPPKLAPNVDWGVLENQFHLTAGYRTTLDIVMPYGYYVRKPPEEIGRSEIIPLLGNKMKLIAWFVSNCEGQSDRMRYVNELRKHVQVDIYGRCGDLECPKDAGFDACDEMLKSDYKFYLAFESTLCTDYISEKAWYHLGSVVPIVLGGGDYERHMPPHSVINVRHYESAAHLAKYLRHLDKQPRLYEEYYHWTYRYRSYSYHLELRPSWPCEICRYINTHSFTHAQLMNPRVDLNDMTNINRSCLDPDSFYQGIL